MWKKEEKGRVMTLKAKRIRVNKTEILWEKQSQGNVGYSDGNFFQINQMLSSFLNAKLSSDNFQIESKLENKITLHVFKIGMSLNYRYDTQMLQALSRQRAFLGH